MKLRQTHFEEEVCQKIYDNIGGNATLLDKLLDDMKTYKSLDICIERIILQAILALDAFDLQPILKALKEHPEGVPANYFKGQSYKGVNLAEPKRVGDLLQLRNAIVCRVDMEPNVYQIESIKYKTALKRYEPSIKFWR